MRYLIYSASGIGDFIMALPAACAIRRSDPQAFIQFYSRSTSDLIRNQRQLLDIQDAVDRVNYYSLDEPLHTLGFVLQLGYKTFDYVFVLQHVDYPPMCSSWPARIANWAGKKSVGIAVPERPDIRFDITLPYIPKYYSTREYFDQMLRAVGIEPLTTSFGILPEDKLEPYRRKLGLDAQDRPLIGLCVGAGGVKRKVDGQLVQNYPKNWPYQLWMELAEKLLSAGYGVVLLGGRQEKEAMEAQKISVPEQAIDLIDRVGLKESVAATSVCQLVVCGDTGLMHAADAAGTPVLVLIGCSATNIIPAGNKAGYIRTGVSCSPCYLHSDDALYCKDKKCMASITVEMVYDRIMEMLGAEESRKDV